MKKLLILSLTVLSCALFSCSSDTIPTHSKLADDIGGQSGTIPPPKP